MLVKKAISPVVAMALLLVVAVVAVSSFQGWINNYSSLTFSDVEQKSDVDSLTTGIDVFIGNQLYVLNNGDSNLSIQEVKVGDNVCFVADTVLEQGINELDLGDCISNLTQGSSYDVVVVTDKKIFSKQAIVSGDGSSSLISFVLNTPSNGALLFSEYAKLNLSVNPSNDSLYKLIVYASYNGGGRHLMYYDSDYNTTEDMVYNFSKMPIDFDSSLILHYPLDFLNETNNSYVSDVSGNGYYGTYSVGEFVDSGMIGGAFNKTSATPIYISNATYNDDIINNFENWSMSVWLNPYNPGSPADCGMNIVGAGTWNIYFYITDSCALGVNSYFTGSGEDVTSAGAITVGQWNHVVLTRNVSEFRYYVDGVLFDTGIVSSTQNGDRDDIPLRLGMSGASSYDYYGRFDDLAFFGKTLDGDEVMDIYNMTMHSGTYSWHTVVQNSTGNYTSPNYSFNIN